MKKMTFSILTALFGMLVFVSNIFAQSSTVVRITFTPVQSLAVGELLTLPLTITAGENVAGYQATVSYDTSALRYVSSRNGDYLPEGAFFVPPVVAGNKVTLAATSLAGESNGDGTLAILTFEVVAVKTSTLTLSDVLLTNSASESSRPRVEATQITESAPSSVTVRISSGAVSSPAVGEQFTLPLTITNGANVAGYQATVSYDTSALRYVSSRNGDYLPEGAFFVPPVVAGNKVTLAATSLAGESNGDGTLAILTFEVVTVKASTLTLSEVLLTDGDSQSSRPQVESTQITETSLDSPKIVFESQTIDDSGPLVGWSDGNSNGIAEVGERINLKVTLKNDGVGTAQNVKGFMTTQDKSVHISEALVDYGNIGPGSFGPPLFPIVGFDGRSFKIEIQDSALAHQVTLTLHVTADNAGPWTLRITLAIVNRSEIGLEFPDNLISEEAFGPRSTYFTLKVQHPTLTNVPDDQVFYDDCEIILHIPERTHAFIFPIQTQGERNLDIAKRVVISVGKLVVSKISEALEVLDLILFFREVVESTDSSKYDLKITVPTLFEAGHGRPDTEIDYVVLLKNTTRTLKSIDITIKQKYRVGEPSDSFTVNRTVTWNFDEGWAAPTFQPIGISDYPSFRLLSPEVQDYLLHHFSVFANFETLRVPKETSLLPNYPNPFNPETWIPYQLAEPSDVSISIYAADGRLVRTLDVGHQSAGLYESRSRAAYWDGRNALGEPVASGVYFYTLTTGDFTATRKMLIQK